MFKVKFLKTFVTGHLKGLDYDSELSFCSLSSACEFVAYCHAHFSKPVTPCVGHSKYTISCARIVKGE